MLSEHDIDRELNAALSVSPSPDFAARVLQRVEEDRPSSWAARYGWFAAAASVVIAVGVIYALTRTPSVPPPAPQVVEQAAPRAPIAQPDIPTPTTTPATTREAPRVAVARAASRAPHRAEPEVIVPLNQIEAVRRLVLAVNEGRLKPPVEPLVGPSQGPMAPPAAIGVAPVVVEPIPLSPLGPGTEMATPNIRGIK